LVDILVCGEATIPNSSFIPNKPIYLGVNGSITQIPPTTGVLLILGMPISIDSFIIYPNNPVIL